MRLVGAFLIPVIGVLVLGITSYNNASNAIVDTYKESVQQTADTMQQYINPVSYTHLDVYKRQVLTRTARIRKLLLSLLHT